ncbi:winged helix DNA-binding domain-containing protein [Prauserella endophytica]|uniref:Winged helix DNA-binding domain-containing protein n=1 Tax=Prauserella endophytica TaxID=1592324 RepID=A0ABY2S3U0_9PSEU|nr:winged helix DNA-binding domain-containing protein [Prauserella endophytica]TKG70404.1 winged helix DNA-binding domain-containing protein [Prauserella endophytica]
MTRNVSVAERRARLGVRHRLARSARAGTPEDVAESLLALHATDPGSVYLAAAARMAEPEVRAVEHALYERRSLVRMLGMRRTMFVVPAEVAPLVQAGCAVDIERKQRRLLLQHLEQTGIPGLDAWLRDVEDATVRALETRGTAHATQLAEDEPRLRTEIVMAQGKPYESRGYVTNRVLFLLAVSGRIVRGRPRGTWLSTQYEWAPAEKWLPGGLGDLDPAAARVELARRWLGAFGPAQVSDLVWWTGWTARQAKQALAALDTVAVDMDGIPGIVLADDAGPVPEPEPWVALLPALDPTAMGWAERGWFVGEHRAALFDRTGNIGPTVWSDGRIVGGWAQRPDGEVVVRLLEDPGAEAVAAIEAEAARLTAWLGDVVVVPRFRTPVEKELSS